MNVSMIEFLCLAEAWKRRDQRVFKCFPWHNAKTTDQLVFTKAVNIYCHANEINLSDPKSVETVSAMMDLFKTVLQGACFVKRATYEAYVKFITDQYRQRLKEPVENTNGAEAGNSVQGESAESPSANT